MQYAAMKCRHAYMGKREKSAGWVYPDAGTKTRLRLEQRGNKNLKWLSAGLNHKVSGTHEVYFGGGAGS